jgi:hypothetical protein
MILDVKGPIQEFTFKQKGISWSLYLVVRI